MMQKKIFLLMLTIVLISQYSFSSKSTESNNALALVIKAKTDLNQGNIVEFNAGMNKSILGLGMISARNSFAVVGGNEGLPSVYDLIASLSQVAQRIQPTTFNLAFLSKKYKDTVSFELYKANYMLALSALQLSMAGAVASQNKQVVPSFSDQKSLAIVPLSSKKDMNSVSSALTVVGGNLLDLRENKISLDASVIQDLLTNPLYRSSYYLVTGLAIIDSIMQALQDNKNVVSDFSTSLVPLEQGMAIVPAPASGELVELASQALISFTSGDYSNATTQVMALVRAASDQKNMTYKNGDMNEVLALANLDLLQRVKMLIISNLVALLNYALEETGKNQQDLSNPNFDKSIELYKKAKPEAYQILINRNAIINLVIFIENARLNILEKLSSNYAQLDDSNQQLLLEEVIASKQFESVVSSPLMLESIVSPALIKDFESQATNSIVLLSSQIAKSLATVKPEDQAQAMTLILEQRVLQRLFTDRTDLLKLSKEMDSSLNEVKDHVNQNLSLVESKIEELTKNSGTKNSFNQLTKDFMDKVSSNASGWSIKFESNQDMITNSMTRQVIGSGYSDNEVNYINGYLQSIITKYN